jgi:type I restriction-modification system DNA methylase subunit
VNREEAEEKIFQIEKLYGFSLIAEKIETQKYNGFLVNISPRIKNSNLEQMDFLAECFERKGFVKLRKKSKLGYYYSLFKNA